MTQVIKITAFVALFAGFITVTQIKERKAKPKIERMTFKKLFK